MQVIKTRLTLQEHKPDNPLGQPIIDRQPFTCPFVNFNEKEESTVINSLTMLKHSAWKTYLLLPFLSVITIFVLPIRLYWSAELRAYYLYTRVRTIQEADALLVRGKDGNIEIVAVQNLTEDVRPLGVSAPFLIFTYRFIKFLYNCELALFEPITLDTNLPYDELRERFTMLKSVSQRKLERIKFGECVVDVPEQTVFSLFVHEVLNPFYIFQLFSVALWTYDSYLMYAGCILVVSTIGVTVQMIENIQNNTKIRKMARYTCKIMVRVPNENGHSHSHLEEMDSSQLLPGDIAVIPEGKSLPCDFVLLTGSAIVNEAMLTGESVPVMKSSLPITNMERYSPSRSGKHTLFGGTNVIQTRPAQANEPVFGLVTSTGFLTTKGSLVRDILYPKEIVFQFYKDSYRFVGIMALLAIVGFFATVPLMLRAGTNIANLVDRSLDLLTICVPPALPAAMTCGVVFAIQRLKNQQIYCISPTRVNVAGRVTTFVFDKTGTITEDSLSVLGFRATSNGQFTELQTEMTSHDDCWWTTEDCKKIRNQSETLFEESLASCTEITYVNNILVGDPLDVKMFQATGWVLDEPSSTKGDDVVFAYVYPKRLQSNQPQYSSAIIRRFEFSSALQRMSVICRNEIDNKFRCFVKGSPEMISKLCTKVPPNFKETLQEYTQEGYRVIALAHKLMPDNFKYRQSQTILRQEVEQDLDFLGLLIMENKLKPQSSDVLKIMNECNIRTVMATGDNVLTAISVARQCKMLSPSKTIFLGDLATDVDSLPHVEWTVIGEIESNGLQHPSIEGQLPWHYTDQTIEVALTGPAFRHIRQRKEIDPNTYHQVCIKAQVFARMSPTDKENLVESFQQVLREQIGMCGDGANDCGALKAADVGMSLSEAEASIAAPFTSAVQDISCCITLLREGRCAMTTSFQAFKFIELYSLIQFFSCTMLYTVNSSLTDHQFLYIDLVALIPLSIFSAWTGPYPKLTKHLPTATLFYQPVLISVISSSLVQLMFQVYFFLDVKSQVFYKPPWDEGDGTIYHQRIVSYEDTALFQLTNFQYLITCCSFLVAYPFRKPFYTNRWFLFSTLAIFVCNSLFLALPASNPLTTFFEVQPYTDDYEYKYKVLTGIVLCSVLTFGLEKVNAIYVTAYFDRREAKHRSDQFQAMME